MQRVRPQSVLARRAVGPEDARPEPADARPHRRLDRLDEARALDAPDDEPVDDDAERARAGQARAVGRHVDRRVALEDAAEARRR